MISLIYASIASRPMSQEDLIELLKQSRLKNRRLSVTGLLLYINGSFMQVLEGKEQAVRSLMQSIEADPRHHSVQTLEVQPLPVRVFPDWTMAFLNGSNPALHRIRGYSRFLERPTSTEDILQSKDRAHDLLLYFKLVMEASNGNLQTLLDAFPENL